jgi:hypothetical protein
MLKSTVEVVASIRVPYQKDYLKIPRGTKLCLIQDGQVDNTYEIGEGPLEGETFTLKKDDQRNLKLRLKDRGI